MIGTGRLARDGRYFNPSEIADLEQRRKLELTRVDWSHPGLPIFAAPINAQKLGSSLYLSANNGRQEAVDAYVQAQGHGQPVGTQVTGWWAVSDEGVDRLVREHGIILGVTGGFVFEGARIEALAKTGDWYRRRAFLVTPLDSTELQPYLGFVPGMTPTGFAVTL